MLLHLLDKECNASALKSKYYPLLSSPRGKQIFTEDYLQPNKTNLKILLKRNETTVKQKWKKKNFFFPKI